MWCRNSTRIAFHSSTTSKQRYNLTSDIFDRFDMLAYPMPINHYHHLGGGIYTRVPMDIIYDEERPAVAQKEPSIPDRSRSEVAYKLISDMLHLFAISLVAILLLVSVYSWFYPIN